MTRLNKLKAACSFIGGNLKTAFQGFEENNQGGLQFHRRQLEIVFQGFEENQKKPEGCF